MKKIQTFVIIGIIIATSVVFYYTFEHRQSLSDLKPVSGKNYFMNETIAQRSMYVHISFDGRLFMISGKTGRASWSNIDEVKEEIHRVREEEGMILYSCELPDIDSPRIVDENFSLIMKSRLPMVLVEQHPLVRQ